MVGNGFCNFLPSSVLFFCKKKVRRQRGNIKDNECSRDYLNEISGEKEEEKKERTLPWQVSAWSDIRVTPSYMGKPKVFWALELLLMRS